MYYITIIFIIILFIMFFYYLYHELITENIPIWSNIYLLNLKRREDKLNNTLIELNNNNITKNIIVIHGIDGLKLPEQKTLVKQNILHENFLKYKWIAQKRGAIANYLSMVEIYKNILKNNSEINLIIEDDIIITKDFWNVINDFKNLYFNDWDLIYLGISNLTIYNTKNNWKLFKKINDIYSLYIPDSNNGSLYGNFGLMVKKKVAEIWLNNYLPITQASDSRLGSFVTGKVDSIDNIGKIITSEPKLKGYIIYPPIITYTFKISDTNNIL